MSEAEIISLVAQKAMDKNILLSCHFDLTYKCNLNCVHCYVNRQDSPELETSDIKRILDQLADIGTLYLHLSGGEVFTREDFFEIAEYARKLHFALRILTNGTLIDEEVADKLAALNPAKIKLSIYGSNPEIHDKVTGVPGSFKKTMKAAELLKERNLNLTISTVIMKQNIQDYHKVHKIAQSLGAKFVADPTVTTKIDGDRYPLKFRISKEELYQVLSDPVILNSEDEDPEIHSKDLVNSVPCSATHSYCEISPYGDVFPCVQFPIKCGNLKDNSLEEIWHHSPEILKIKSLRISIYRPVQNVNLLVTVVTAWELPI